MANGHNENGQEEGRENTTVVAKTTKKEKISVSVFLEDDGHVDGSVFVGDRIYGL